MMAWCRRCSRMMTDTRPHPRCVVCDYPLTPEAEVDIDAPLAPPGPLRRVQLGCSWPAGPLRSMCIPGPWTGAVYCYSHEGEKCRRGDDAASCPYAFWLELDCEGRGADCEGQLVKPEAEELGTEAEGIAELLSDVWSFVDGDDDPYTWAVIRAGRSAHERAHVEWCRESAARFMARARITTGDCEGLEDA